MNKTVPSQRVKRTCALVVWLVCFWTLGLPSAQALTAVPVATAPVVTKLKLVKTEKISKTVSKLTYSVSVRNPLTRSLTGVRAIATSRVSSSRLLDATVSFPAIPAGKTVLSTDTITLRQDTRKRVTAATLAWSVGAGLSGARGALATRGTTKLTGPPVDTTQIRNDVLMSRLIVVVMPTATVAEIDAALDKVDGTIVTMRPDSTFLTVAIPKASSFAALEQQRKSLEDSAGIAFVLTATQPAASVLPGETAHAPAQNINDFSHLLATRFPAAWNAKGLIVDSAGTCLRPASQRVPVLVPDI